MTIRDDLKIEYVADPRIVEVSSPSQEITMQDLISTLRQAEGTFEGISWKKLLNASGKEDLGGGVRVGLTASLQNAKIAFEARTVAAETGTCTGSPTSPVSGRLILQDTNADFEAAGIQRGSLVINFDDKSLADVISVDSTSQLTTKTLVNGSLNVFTIGDSYQVFNIVQCSAKGGNLVSVNENQDTIPAVLPTAFTQVVVTSSASATLQESSAIQYASYGGGVTINVLEGYSGVNFPTGTIEQPVNNIQDAVEIAETKGFNKIFVFGDLHLSGDVDVSDLIFQGNTINKTTITIDSEVNVYGCEFLNATINGTLDGNTQFTKCIVDDLIYVNGQVDSSWLKGNIYLDGGANAVFSNCSTYDPYDPPCG